VLLVELAELLVRLAALVFAEERMPSKVYANSTAALQRRRRCNGSLRPAASCAVRTSPAFAEERAAP
jgi:hypothetical protein